MLPTDPLRGGLGSPREAFSGPSDAVRGRFHPFGVRWPVAVLPGTSHLPVDNSENDENAVGVAVNK
jgi:hypothetical protein